MQALKFLITILTLLIVIAMTVIAYGMYRKSVDPDFKFFKLGDNKATIGETQLSSSPTTIGGNKNVSFKSNTFGEVVLSLPKGCNISTVSGDSNKLFLKVGPSGNKCERVMVINPNNGIILGTIKVAP